MDSQESPLLFGDPSLFENDVEMEDSGSDSEDETDSDESGDETENDSRGNNSGGATLLSWEREMDILIKGTREERLHFIRTHSATSVTPFGLRTIVQGFLDGGVEQLAHFHFLETMVAEGHKPAFRQTVQAFRDFPYRLIPHIKTWTEGTLLEDFPGVALSMGCLFKVLPPYGSHWISRPLGDEEASFLCFFPIELDSKKQDIQVLRKRTVKALLFYLLGEVRRSKRPMPRFQAKLIDFVKKLLEDPHTGQDMFEDPICDLHTNESLRMILSSLLGSLILNSGSLDPILVEMIESHLESDFVWALLAEISSGPLELIGPLVAIASGSDGPTSQEEEGKSLCLEEAALDLLDHGLASGQLSFDPCLRGLMLHALWFLGNLCAEDCFKPVFKRERPLRIFIACWAIQSFHDTTTILFKSLFSPDQATVDLMGRLGWSSAYQNSTEILDILDF